MVSKYIENPHRVKPSSYNLSLPGAKPGVIWLQEEPAEGVKSLFVVQRLTAAARLCIVPRDLNVATKRSHSLPHVEC